MLCHMGVICHMLSSALLIKQSILNNWVFHTVSQENSDNCPSVCFVLFSHVFVCV